MAGRRLYGASSFPDEAVDNYLERLPEKRTAAALAGGSRFSALAAYPPRAGVGATPAKVRKSTMRKSPVTLPSRCGSVGFQRESAAR